MSSQLRYSLVWVSVGLACMGCERQVLPPADQTAALAATEDTTHTAPVPLADSRAAETATPDPIRELNSKLESMGAKVVAEPAAPATGAGSADYDALKAELAELRAEVKRLQETVDLTVAYVVGDLHEENRRLREEVARAYASPPEAPGTAREELQSKLAELGIPQSALPGDSPAADMHDYGENGYLVVKEWGRSPEDVASLGANVPSLKGLICAVPKNLSDADYSELGRRIRQEFEAYDNIVIDVFTDETAARAFAEKNLRSTEYNVLSIQKDGNSGTDHILLHRNGVTVDVPR